jgi:hypothetical protein
MTEYIDTRGYMDTRGYRTNEPLWPTWANNNSTAEVDNLKNKLQSFRQYMEKVKNETPGPQTAEWIRKFDEMFGKL